MSDEFKFPTIFGGIGRSQAPGVYALTVGSEHGTANVYGTLAEVRTVVEALLQDLEMHTHEAAAHASSSAAQDSQDRG